MVPKILREITKSTCTYLAHFAPKEFFVSSSDNFTLKNIATLTYSFIDCILSQMSDHQISPIEAYRMRQECLFLDVRNEDEFQECHIEGAVLHPLPALDCRSVELLQKGRRCLLVCAAGRRAQVAFERLSAGGRTDLLVLSGGMQSWISAGLPVTRNDDVPSQIFDSP